GLAARAPDAARLRLWAPQAHPGAPARSRRSGRVSSGPCGGGKKRWWRSPTNSRCTTRTRPTWRRTRTCVRSGIGAASSRRCPRLNPKEREWKVLKRDVRSHLAPTLRAFVDEIGAGLRQLGGRRIDVVDHVPDWFIAGHRKEPTGRPPGRPKGAKDSYKRAPY